MSIARLMQQAAAGGVPTGGWDLANAAYNGSPINWFYVAAQDTSPADVFFKPDGTKMYIVGRTGQDVNEYSLSSAWDVSTASYVQNFSIGAQETAPNGVFFKSDGTKMYITGQSGDDVNEYSLSSAWDISTASYVQNFSIGAQESVPQGVFFKSDGTKMYIVGSSGDDVNEYSLSSAWDVSTASYVQNFSVAAQETGPGGVFFKSDGTKMYIVGGSKSDAVFEYSLSSAWDISTASFTYPATDYFSVETEETAPNDLFFKDDGTKMYIVGQTGDAVYEYSLSSAWDVSTASYVQNFSVAAQELNPQGVFFKSDGTKMYITGQSGDDVNEYSLSSAWDISTASYVQNFSVAAQETNPGGVFFKPDGTKMYIVGSTGVDVNEYSLSSAWDVSTASYVQNFSVAAQETNPTGVFFKDDGTKMYIVGNNADAVNEYSLSSAWDISTASYVQNFSVAAQATLPRDLFFKDDGTKMYIVDSVGDAVFSYDL